MPQILPPSRPKWDRAKVEAKLAANHCPDWPIRVLGVRGYFQDSLGQPGVNDRNLYDDAMFAVGQGNRFAAFNANCDPSIYRPNVATLLPGLWWYRIDWHRAEYLAFVQDSPVTVARDDNADPGSEPQLETGWFGINIHPAGLGGTGSLGCQTLPTGRVLGTVNDQWKAFMVSVIGGMDRGNVARFPYALIEEPG